MKNRIATLPADSAAAVLDRFDARLMVATSRILPISEVSRNQTAMLRKLAAEGAENRLGTRYVQLEVAGRPVVELIIRCERDYDVEDVYKMGVEVSWSGCGAKGIDVAEEFAAAVRIATELARELEAGIAIAEQAEWGKADAADPPETCPECDAPVDPKSGVCSRNAGCPGSAADLETVLAMAVDDENDACPGSSSPRSDLLIDVEDRCPTCGGFVDRFIERDDGSMEPIEPYCTACGVSIDAETGKVVPVA